MNDVNNPRRAVPDPPAMADAPFAETLPPAPAPLAGQTLTQLPREQQASAAQSKGEARLPDMPGYEIISELGRGGMGVVYKARQRSVNRIVALKMIIAGDYASHQDLMRFQAEAEAVAGLQHPHVVQMFEYGQHEGRPFFALEYVDGGSLAKKAGDKPLPAKAVAKLVEQIALGIAAAHAQGIIHRDLKPENVLLS